jgi:hypothetical protein
LLGLYSVSQRPIDGIGISGVNVVINGYDNLAPNTVGRRAIHRLPGLGRMGLFHFYHAIGQAAATFVKTYIQHWQATIVSQELI